MPFIHELGHEERLEEMTSLAIRIGGAHFLVAFREHDHEEGNLVHKMADEKKMEWSANACVLIEMSSHCTVDLPLRRSTN